jgi:hypothetical protein
MEQVKRYLELPSSANVSVFIFEDYQRNPQRVLASVFHFLTVDAGFLVDTSRRYLEAQIPRSIAISRFVKRVGIWRPGSLDFQRGKTSASVGTKELWPKVLRRRFRAICFRQRESLCDGPKN